MPERTVWDELKDIVAKEAAADGQHYMIPTSPDRRRTAVPFLAYMCTERIRLGIATFPLLEACIAIQDDTFMDDLKIDPVSLARFRAVYGYGDSDA